MNWQSRKRYNKCCAAAAAVLMLSNRLQPKLRCCVAGVLDQVLQVEPNPVSPTSRCIYPSSRAHSASPSSPLYAFLLRLFPLLTVEHPGRVGRVAHRPVRRGLLLWFPRGRQGVGLHQELPVLGRTTGEFRENWQNTVMCDCRVHKATMDHNKTWLSLCARLFASVRRSNYHAS